MRRLLLLLCFIAVFLYAYKFIFIDKNLSAKYETVNYNTSFYRGKAYAADLCIVSDNVYLKNAPETDTLKAAGLFNIKESTTEFAYNMHEKLYPASTTKIMTALVALKNGKLSDIVTVGKNADSDSFAFDEATCGIQEGDQLTLEDLLYGLLLYSGNDTAVAIAEHIAGSVEDFADMMNAQAKELMATKTNFVNPSGLYDDNHYTTAYDLYLIFNECIKYEEFIKIISTDSYEANITGVDGIKRSIRLEPTNYYATGHAKSPENVNIIGGKTGTLKVAGNCLILLEEDKNNNPYISIVMGADSKEILYQDMTTIINSISANNP